jgi:hypothetical protein
MIAGWLTGSGLVLVVLLITGKSWCKGFARPFPTFSRSFFDGDLIYMCDIGHFHLDNFW